MKKKKIILSLIVFILIAATVLLLASALLRPKYTQNHIPDGALVGEYYKETSGHSVIFIGDCEVYENCSPLVLWEEYGINSCVRGSPQQLIWQSYYFMEETLRYEKPEAFVFNVLSMKYSEPQSEEYNRLALDDMKLSKYKIASIKASMTEDENIISYIFPFLRYHSRWSDLSSDDFKYMFRSPKDVSVNGFLINCAVDPLTSFPYITPLSDYSFGETSWEYLDKMRDLCNNNGVKLILVKAPTISKDCPWFDEWDTQICEYAEENDIPYYNFLKLDPADFNNSKSVPVYTNEPYDAGIDFSADTSDKGKHLNLYGAEKYTRALGAILADMGISDQSSDPALRASWEEKKKIYEGKVLDSEMKNQKYD